MERFEAYVEKGNAELSLQIDAYLPDEYISDERHKIEIYKRIRQIDNRVNYEELQDELIDRFGEYPDVVAYLIIFFISDIKYNFNQTLILRNISLQIWLRKSLEIILG